MLKHSQTILFFLLIVLLSVTACTPPPATTVTPVTEATAISSPESTSRPAEKAEAPPATSSPIPVPPTSTNTATATVETKPAVDLPIETPPSTLTPILPSPTAQTQPAPIATIELAGATLPTGFSLRKVIEVDRPIGLSIDLLGEQLYVSTQLGELRIYKLLDLDKGLIDYTKFKNKISTLHGMAHHPDPNNSDLYISTAGKISILRDTDADGEHDQLIPLVTDLPYGLHQNNVPKFGPDGMLYVGVGSTCDACIEVDERSGTIMRFDPTTGAGEIVASGLRNPFDVAFHPVSGDLFATDNGRDDLGDFDPAEELNHIVLGNDYGWPDCWNIGEGINCDGKTNAIELYTAHSSVNNLLFYTGSSFPSDYTNNLFALNFGSFLVKVDTGLQRTKLTSDGQGSYTAETEWFLTMPENSYPLGLTMGADGSIYFGDYINGGIWRISYEGGK